MQGKRIRPFYIPFCILLFNRLGTLCNFDRRKRSFLSAHLIRLSPVKLVDVITVRRSRLSVGGHGKRRMKATREKIKLIESIAH